MKKVLLATTALVASTGFAMADIELSGKAQAGVASESGSDMEVFHNAGITITLSGMSDNGLGFGTSLSMEADDSNEYDTGDFEFDGDSDGDFGMDPVWISSNGVTVSFFHDGIDDLYDDDMDGHDVQVAYASGGVSLDLTLEVTDDGSDANTSYKFAYAQDGISASLVGNSVDECTRINLGYASGAFSVGLESDMDGTGCDGADGVTTNTLSGSYTMDAFTINAEVDSDDAWEIGASFSQDNMTISAHTDDLSEWEISGSFDAGGGLSFVGGAKFDDSYYLGAEMSF